MVFVCQCADMQSTTPETWQQRADRLGLLAATIAKATDTSVRSVRAYKQGARNPSEEWLARVDAVLTNVERAVSVSPDTAA